MLIGTPVGPFLERHARGEPGREGWRAGADCAMLDCAIVSDHDR
jgi:hypothetical protein